MHAPDRAIRALGWSIGLLLVVGSLVVGFLPPLVVVLSIPFLVLAARKPVLRRLALRNASRRPRETALILLGALLGTAIITGSATVGDTLGSSIRQGAFTKLGPIDEIIRTSGLDTRAAVIAALEAAPDPDVDGVLPIASIGASVATEGQGAERRAEPNAALLEVEFGAARAFGDDPDATGISGATPVPGRAVVGQDLARTLEVGPGDVVDVFAYGAMRTFTIDRVVPRRGIAGFDLGFGSQSPNLFVTPGTIAELAGANPGVGSPPSSLVAISNRGDVIEGADRSLDVTNRVLVPALTAAGIEGQTDLVKRDLLDAAQAQGASFTQLFTALGTFSALAGILLLISIFVMLAEERKTELGMLRAVGLKRAGLIGAFSLEGWMYAVAAAALGTIAGIGVGRAIVAVTAGIFAGDGQFALELRFTASPASIQRGFLLGFVFSLLTVLATSWWISRLNVIRAIRDLPDPTVVHQRLRTLLAGVLLLLLGGLLTTTGLAGKASAPLLVGPPLMAMGVAVVLRRWVAKKLVDSVAAVTGLLWATFCFDLASDVFTNPDISLFVLDGVVLSVAGVVLVSRHQALVGSVVRRAGGGNKNMSLRLGLAYPLAKAFRTSLILSTFTLVMFTLAGDHALQRRLRPADRRLHRRHQRWLRWSGPLQREQPGAGRGGAGHRGRHHGGVAGDGRRPVRCGDAPRRSRGSAVPALAPRRLRRVVRRWWPPFAAGVPPRARDGGGRLAGVAQRPDARDRRRVLPPAWRRPADGDGVSRPASDGPGPGHRCDARARGGGAGRRWFRPGSRLPRHRGRPLARG